MLSEMGTLTELVSEPGPALLDRILSDVPPPQRQPLLRRALADQRVHRAALSLGGAVVGATAVALVWWRLSRRPEGDSAPAGLSPADTLAS
jgi:hypothetical protein